jgi:hypothetical protein
MQQVTNLMQQQATSIPMQTQSFVVNATINFNALGLFRAVVGAVVCGCQRSVIGTKEKGNLDMAHTRTHKTHALRPLLLTPESTNLRDDVLSGVEEPWDRHEDRANMWY